MSLRYRNPVYDGYFADPFVLKYKGEYYAYGTGSCPGNEPEGKGRLFPVLRSSDLVHWEYVSGALEPLGNVAESAYWAPEVAERDGVFFMYYSAALGPTDDTHRLCVAVADNPTGPFKDQGKLILPDEGFTIDANPFRDPKDGRWYLFFATDFFDGRVGTGLKVVPLKDDMMTPAEEPRTVLRARHDWQIFQRNRPLYGRVWDAWHTVEGPCAFEHDGKYYCLYSGGLWDSPDYGVSYGVADHPLGPYRDQSGPEGPDLLRAIPGKALGPGHNSVTIGPDGKTMFIVYHAWDADRTARRMCIDPLHFTPAGLNPDYSLSPRATGLRVV